MICHGDPGDLRWSLPYPHIGKSFCHLEKLGIFDRLSRTIIRDLAISLAVILLGPKHFLNYGYSAVVPEL